jgi:hypothetical protein
VTAKIVDENTIARFFGNAGVHLKLFALPDVIYSVLRLRWLRLYGSSSEVIIDGRLKHDHQV